MSSLESLVPPLELCRQIPEGKFADSVFVRLGETCDGDEVPGNPVWRRDTKIQRHMAACGVRMYPAPTLQEILIDLPEFIKEDLECYLCVFDVRDQPNGDWQFGYARGYRGSLTALKSLITRDKNPVTAALKLWLKIEERKTNKEEEKLKNEQP